MSLEDELEAQRQRAYAQRSPAERKVRAAAVTAVANAQTAERALGEGEPVPRFQLPIDRQARLADAGLLLERGPLVISFYRGGWCPYCNIELRSLQRPAARYRGAGRQPGRDQPGNAGSHADDRGERRPDVPGAVRQGKRGRAPIPPDASDRPASRPLPAWQRQRCRRLQRHGHRGGTVAGDIRSRYGRGRPLRLRGRRLHAASRSRGPHRRAPRPRDRARRDVRHRVRTGQRDRRERLPCRASRSRQRCSRPSAVPAAPGPERSCPP